MILCEKHGVARILGNTLLMEPSSRSTMKSKQPHWKMPKGITFLNTWTIPLGSAIWTGNLFHTGARELLESAVDGSIRLNPTSWNCAPLRNPSFSRPFARFRSGSQPVHKRSSLLRNMSLDAPLFGPRVCWGSSRFWLHCRVKQVSNYVLWRQSLREGLELGPRQLHGHGYQSFQSAAKTLALSFDRGFRGRTWRRWCQTDPEPALISLYRFTQLVDDEQISHTLIQRQATGMCVCVCACLCANVNAYLLLLWSMNVIIREREREGERGR